jgi:hypothetical protein
MFLDREMQIEQSVSTYSGEMRAAVSRLRSLVERVPLLRETFGCAAV